MSEASLDIVQRECEPSFSGRLGVSVQTASEGLVGRDKQNRATEVLRGFQVKEQHCGSSLSFFFPWF